MRQGSLRAIAALLAAIWLAAPAAAKPPIGLTRAVEIAERALAAHAVAAELEREGERAIYEIDLVRDGRLLEARIRAADGRLLTATRPLVRGYWHRLFRAENLRAAGRARPLAETLAALERQNGGEVRAVSLEVEDGRAMYRVRIASGAGIAEIRVDPITGRRISFRYDE